MDTPHDRSPLAALLRPAHPIRLDPATTALFVVDLQYFDAHRDWGEGRTAKDVGVAHCFEPYFRRVDEVLPRVQELLAAFRAQGAEVVHVRVAERTADSRDVAPKQLLRGLIVPSTSREAAFLEAVAPEGDELVFDKSSSGMFPATNVDRILRNLGATTLVFCGTSTGGCVESAVRDAVDLGYRVVVVDDACAASTPLDHGQALARMQGPTCWVATAAEVAAELARHPARDRAAVAGTTRVRPFLPKPGGTPDPAADPYELIFPPPQRVAVTAADTAVLVLDAHALAVDPHGPLLAAARAADPASDATTFHGRIDAAVAALGRLLEAAHGAGVRVIHVRTAGRTRDGRDLAPGLKAILGALPADHPAAALDPRVPRHPDDLLLTKPGQGPFTGTGLDDTLRHLGVTKLVIGGVSTLGAVEAALRGATDRGYGVLLVPDACAATTLAGQRKLAAMGAGLIEVTSVEDGVARLRAG
jgi:ureidoacrylate peracid hydrolase